MPKLIKGDAVVRDEWIVLSEGAQPRDAAALVNVIVPLPLWQAGGLALRARNDVGVWLAPADDPAVLADDVGRLPVIAVQFPKFGDGRGFSTARLLRDRHGFKGELRAFGDVFRDQLFFMAECGFDAFMVRSDLDPHQEIAGLHVFGRTYTYSTRTPRPWFRERQATGDGA